MTRAVQHILESFKQLSEVEKHELAVEILRRTVGRDSPRLSDDDLVLSAEALFLDLDGAEAQNDQP
jgi:hypothetical protein